MKERLQKILSREGFGSRRDCENLIQNNRVKINGIIATIGMTADSDIDQIKVDENREDNPKKKSSTSFTNQRMFCQI